MIGGLWPLFRKDILLEGIMTNIRPMCFQSPAQYLSGDILEERPSAQKLGRSIVKVPRNSTG